VSDLIADLRKAMAVTKDLPPPVDHIVATHSVPYGKVFRMYNTRGRMVVYVNRGMVADLPRREPSSDLPVFGIPVVEE
jgi:hypothetical protein